MNIQQTDYCFAGCYVRLISREPICKNGFFSDFCTKADKADYTVEIFRTNALPAADGELISDCDRKRIYRNVNGTSKSYSAYFNAAVGSYTDYACRENDSVIYISDKEEFREDVIFDALDLPELLLKKGIGILHCSFIEYNGEAVLFAGDKQVGKSTQAALWSRYRNADVLNGDRAALTVEDGGVYAHGVPFCGTSGICKNKKLPVKAIICLSKGSENIISEMSVLEAYLWLLNKLTYNNYLADSSEAASRLLDEAVNKIPVFSYSCLNDKTAVDYLETALK